MVAYEVVLTTENGDATAYVSVMSYMYAAMSGSGSTNLKNMITALYNYYTANLVYRDPSQE